MFFLSPKNYKKAFLSESWKLKHNERHHRCFFFFYTQNLSSLNHIIIVILLSVEQMIELKEKTYKMKKICGTPTEGKVFI